ncbi:MAG: metal ABC transporter permease [Propionibacteriaceae bacterium]|nr:metal ABC transporter permease [Propionibacteriaceae bacterium]
MSFATWVMILAVVTALACALPGVWLVLRRQSMLTDAISHSVLPGIVVAAVASGTLHSPWSILGAALMGMLVVMGAEFLESTGLISGDGPQGLIFPALFSIGVILVSTRFSQVAVSESAILVGDLNLAAFLPLQIGGTDLGPQYLWVMGGVLLLNIVFLALFHRQLKLITFDRELATTMGLRVRLLNQAMMLLVSVTITASFYAAGAVLVVALMIVPAAVAQLVSRSLPVMFTVVSVVAVSNAVAGFWVAYWLDAATSSGLAVFYGLTFLVVQAVVLLNRRARRARVAVS